MRHNSGFDWVEQLSGKNWPDSADGQMWRIKIPEQLEEWTFTKLVKIEKRHYSGEYQEFSFGHLCLKCLLDIQVEKAIGYTNL